MTHERRSHKKTTEIEVSANSILSVTHELFLGSLNNKKNFIDLLTACFVKNGIKVIQAVDDADTLIAQEAIRHAIVSDTVVIGKDTNLIVVLWHLVDPKETRSMLKITKHAGTSTT